MNKSAIQKFAVQARTDLIAQVKQQAYNYGIDANSFGDKDAEIVNGTALSKDKVKQRRELIDEMQREGYEQVMEKVAYTWFNRFIALRFMEVNHYLPSHIRVFSNDKGEFKPEILTNALSLDLDGLDKSKVMELLDDPQGSEDLYRYLLLTQCNALHSALPQMFEKVGEYKELLLPLKILSEDSVIAHMINDIPENVFNILSINESGEVNGQVEILGWLYQYYISAPKDILINAKKQYKKDEIPFVTQIFTSDWIVKYIVDNSLGRYWIERNLNSPLKSKLEYLVEPKNGFEDYSHLPVDPKEITFFDPCMGSGHILVYAFDIFMEMYKEYGYSERDAVQSILKNNLFGADIDERAYQFAYFAIKIKARSFDRGFFRNRNLEPNLIAIGESNSIKTVAFDGIADDVKQNEIGCYLQTAYKNAKEIGTLSSIEDMDYENYLAYLDQCKIIGQASFDSSDWIKDDKPQLQQLAKQAMIMQQEYTIVCTNPPYLPNKKMPSNLKQFIEDSYQEYKSDTFSAFIVRCLKYTKKQGYVGMLTPLVWMFISSHELLRNNILTNSNISSLVQLEYNAFEAACVPVCCFVLEKQSLTDLGSYIRLSEFKGPDIQGPKTLEAINNFECGYRYEILKNEFKNIPTSPIAYWATKQMIDSFTKGEKVDEFAFPKQGLATADNNRFLRLWFEVCDEKSYLNCNSRETAKKSLKKWFPYNKGGGYKKWFGSNEYLVNWEEDGFEICNFKGENGKIKSRPQNMDWYFKQGLSWCKITSSAFSMRYIPQGFLFDVAGCTLFADEKDLAYLLGYMNSTVNIELLGLISPTLNFEVGHVGSLPIIFEESKRSEVESLVQSNIAISQKDWNEYEVSWDFKKNPLLNGVTIEATYVEWKKMCEESTLQLKENEELLNTYFLQIYNLEDDISSDVLDKDITLKANTSYRYKQNKKNDNVSEFEKSEEVVEAQEVREQRFLYDTVCEFVSYAVGCMFGRYSLDVDGLVYAGGDFDISKYSTFTPDTDNIIPICDDEYFEDDIVGRFCDFVETAYGKPTLESNLTFIANALGGKGTSREIIRQYFVNDFYKNHCNMYTSRGAGKRPIYWLFDSGKKNGFKALIYMHRYESDLLARIRTDYVHEQQERYRTQMASLEENMVSATPAERTKMTKAHKKLQEQALEIQKYEEKIHHLADQNISIDLDDGVVKNYAIFSDVVSKIK